jgi:5'-3' exonuclease
MGIEDLLTGIKKDLKDVYQEDVYLGLFRGMRVAVDISLYAYKYMFVARKESLRYCDFIYEDPRHNILRSFWLERCFDFLMLFIDELVTPIVVFDGPPFRLKLDTKNERKAKTEERQKKIDDLRRELKAMNSQALQSPEGQVKLETLERELGFHVNFEREDWDYLEDMVRSMGIPVIKAWTEAEAVCARLVRNGIAAAVVTNDGDALPHLASIMIIDVRQNYRLDSPYHKCTCIILDNVLQGLRFNPAMFIDFCMLLGTDYNHRIKNNGWTTALKEIRAAGSLEVAVVNIGNKIAESKRKALAKYEKDLAKAEETGKEVKRSKRLDDPDIHEYRLANNDIVREIRGYFLSDFDVEVERNLVVFYADEFGEVEYSVMGEVLSHGERNVTRVCNTNRRKVMTLEKCIETIFTTQNRKRMMERMGEVVKQMKNFNQSFAELQNFVLVIQEEIVADPFSKDKLTESVKDLL